VNTGMTVFALFDVILTSYQKEELFLQTRHRRSS